MARDPQACRTRIIYHVSALWRLGTAYCANVIYIYIYIHMGVGTMYCTYSTHEKGISTG